MDATTHTGNIDGIYHLRNPKNTAASIQALPNDAHWVLGVLPGRLLPLAPPCNRQRPFFVAGDRQNVPWGHRAGVSDTGAEPATV